MKLIYYIVKHFVFIIVCFLTSCVTYTLDEFPDFISSPVINSVLIAGEPIKMHISLAQKLDSESLYVISNAKVLLFIDDVFSDSLCYNELGYYITDKVAVEGKIYRCEVNIPDYDKLVVCDSLPFAAPIIGIEHISYGGKDEEGTIFPTVKITFENDLLCKQYFEIKLSSGIIHTITDPVLLGEGLPIALFSSELIEDSVYTITLNYTTGSASSNGNGSWYTHLEPLTVELRSVSWSYYNYIKQMYLYEKGIEADFLVSNMTSYPLFSNVANGYGIFAAYSKNVSKTIIPEPYVEN